LHRKQNPEIITNRDSACENKRPAASRASILDSIHPSTYPSIYHTIFRNHGHKGIGPPFIAFSLYVGEYIVHHAIEENIDSFFQRKKYLGNQFGYEDLVRK
jgi:hypothetical protein